MKSPNTRPARQRKPLALILPLALASQLAIVQPAAAQAATRHYQIPAGPLDATLNRFALLAGVSLVIDAEKLKGLNSNGLKGNHDVDSGFRTLLHNTGFGVARTASGYILVELPKSGTDTGQRMPGHHGETSLAPVLVVEQREWQGTTLVDRHTIEAMPAGNGDITSLLKIHPSVQFDNLQLSSKTPGEISPANISINGAKFYQNAFLIDGLNMNNDIDPAQSNPNLAADVPGKSQGLALDTDLLESIAVYDSNVPAAYGRFNGGVIEAITRKPSKELHGKLSYQTSRSSWTRYKIDETQRESFENSANYDEQPNFTKTVIRATLEGHLTEDFGLMANFSQKRSTMPTSFYSSNNVGTMGMEKRDQERQIDNYFIKAFWRPIRRLDIESSLTYAPENNTYWRGNTANSTFETQSGGTQFNLKARWDGDLAKVEQNLAYGRLHQSRDSDYDDWYTWRKSTTKNWGVGNSTGANSLEGGYGDVEQAQNTWQYRLNADWRPFEALGTRHRLQSGLEISQQYVRYARLTENSTYVIPASTNTCTNSSGITDDITCSIGQTNNGWPGQYFTQRTRFTTGEFDFTTTQWALWLQDEISVGRFNLRPGVRVDNDDYMNKTTLAPRFAAQYDIFGDYRTVLSAGANRYYGRNITSWRLQEGRNRLRYNTERRPTLDDDWTVGTQATNLVKFSELEVPYDDELMLGLSQRWRGLKFDLKYVNRKGRDQILEVSGTSIGQPSTDPTLSNSYTTYTNGGRSETDIVTLTVTPLQDLRWLGTYTTGLLALDWRDSKQNAPNYLYDSTESEAYVRNPWIQYDGQIIRYADRPANNYSRPWTLRLSTITKIPAWHLTWTNFLRYRAAFSKMAQTVSASTSTVYHDGQQVAIWEKRTFNRSLTWDIRLGWELPIANSHAFFVNVDVFNVLDKATVADSTTATSTGVPIYEVGRQFWLEVGYRF
ncbi:TonB-dependent siderophore receptor [Azonexus sp. R2A61]|uniref:TonB-dependent receptor plug domain-containing protein n=1 Tax=Azonexus sp. R2A61 TaxID=2744443 RepID=UPI001F449F55|nr:TonB-dependent receptor plug domain-containing protein [Azonexus sp. R2A61]